MRPGSGPLLCFLCLFALLYFSVGSQLKKGDSELEEEETSDRLQPNVGEDNQEAEEVVEVENAITGNGPEECQSPEQILEACSSLNESFSKECSVLELETGLSNLVSACKDSISDLKLVEEVSMKISEEYSDRELSDLSECSAMVYTTSMFIASKKEQSSDDDSSESLDVKSLETDETENLSEYEEQA